MAYQLPIVATIQDGGCTFRVRALPWGLAREFAKPGADNFALGAAVFERCVDVEDGDKPPLDDLPAPLVARFAQLASGAKADGDAADPSSPPPPTARGCGG